MALSVILFFYGGVIIIYLQTNEEDCGWACISNILNMYRSKVNITYLKAHSSILRSELSAYDIIEILKDYKINSEGYQIDNIDLENILKKGPIIAQIQKSGAFHFIVLERIVNDKIYVVDPAIGSYAENIQSFEQSFTSFIITTSTSKDYTPQVHKIKFPFSFFSSLISYKVIFYLMFLTIFLSSAEFISVYILKIIVDRVIPHSNISLLLLVLTTGFISFLIYAVLLYIKNYFTFNISQKISETIFFEFIDKVMKQKILFFKNYSIGDFTSRLSDINEISASFMYLTSSLLINIILVVLLTAAISFKSPLFILIILIYFIFYYFIINYFNKKYSSLYNASKEQLSIFSNIYISTIKNIFSIKTFSNTFTSINIIKDNYSTVNERNKHAFIHQNKQLVMLDLSKNFFEISMYGYGCICVMNNQISLGTFVLITTLVQYLNSSFESISQFPIIIQKLIVSVDRISNFARENKQLMNTSNSRIKTFSMDRINFSNATLKLEEKIIYNNLNYDLNLKSTPIIGITGASGIGKSTLMGTLVGLYKLTKGDILINNKSINELNTQSLRKCIVLLNQTPQIFPGYIHSLNEQDLRFLFNLLETVGLVSELSIENQSHIKNIISNQSRLSGGQKQRLYICMAIAKNPKLLILDETFSGLNEHWIQVILNILRDKKIKCIIISHDHKILSKTDKTINITSQKEDK